MDKSISILDKDYLQWVQERLQTLSAETDKGCDACQQRDATFLLGFGTGYCWSGIRKSLQKQVLCNS